jgi:hypothetical protein
MADSGVLGADKCFRCGAPFPEGGLRYRVDVRVSADTGDTLATVEELEKELGRLIDVLEKKKTEELEREVHEDFHFVLCKACKDEYLKGPDVPLGTFFFGE